MTEIIKTSTAIITKQITEAGETELITNHGFMITDLIIDSTGPGQVTVLVKDQEHTHILAVLREKDRFNHAFAGGWLFWDTARLSIIKEFYSGEVNVAIGYVKIYRAPTYNQWLRR